ncbi:MAG: sulfotransferase family protein [Solirubrobacteraceae bacterium]
MRLPDFFIVGHSKSGTTALYEMLRQHPQIYLPAAKEPWFFARELHDRPPPRPEGIPATLDDYADWFAAAADDQLVGEGSPQYLRSPTAAEAIAEVLPDARVIAIFREPASFLRSLHLQFVQSNIETESRFDRALELEQSRREGHHLPRHTYWPGSLLYSQHVRYREQLSRFHAVFPRENVHVIVYEDFRAENDAVIRGIMRFLGVDDSVAIQPVQANPTVRPRAQLLNEAVHAVGVGRGPVSRGVKQSIKVITPARLRRRALHAVRQHVVFSSPPPPDEVLMAQLRARLKPEVVSFGDYLERDLVRLWGYDRD